MQEIGAPTPRAAPDGCAPPGDPDEEWVELRTATSRRCGERHPNASRNASRRTTSDTVSRSDVFSPDLAVIVSLENRYAVPFLSGRAAFSLPLNARQVDVTGIDDTATLQVAFGGEVVF